MKHFLMTITFLLATTTAYAESFNYDVGGMHCGGCVKSIKATVCKLEGVDQCEVEVGHLKVTTKAGATLGHEQILQAVQKAGEYTLTPAKKDNK